MKQVAAVLVIAGSVAVAALYWSQAQPAPFVVSGFIEADEIRVGSRVGGRVARVTVEEGETVERGRLLYELDPFDLKAELSGAQAELAAAGAEHARLLAGFRKEEIDQARARVARAKAVLDKRVAGPRPQEVAVARERLKRSEANLELAEQEYNRVVQLRRTKDAADIEYDRAVRDLKAARAEAAEAKEALALLEAGTREEEIAEARAEWAEARGALNLLEAGYRQEDIAEAAARLEAARAEVHRIETRIDELTVESPCDCVVEAIDLRPGDLVSPNAPTVALLDLSRMWVRSYVPEARLGEVHLGQRVPLRVTSLPDARVHGRVTFIATDAEFTPKNVQTPEERSKQVFRIKVRLEQGRQDLRVGMSADLLFDE